MCTLIYADSKGESHFKNVDIELKLVDFAPPAPPFNISPFNPATQYAFCVIPGEWFGDWHTAPKKQFFFILTGEIDVIVSDGEVRHFSAGSIILTEDTQGKGHVFHVVDDTDVTAAIVQLPD
ncbi:MAG: hypothetical protein QG670_762 [Thermoproteota archaeon]|nr:hypothetical protein [Thermoproteota archaeon]